MKGERTQIDEKTGEARVYKLEDLTKSGKLDPEASKTMTDFAQPIIEADEKERKRIDEAKATQ